MNRIYFTDTNHGVTQVVPWTCPSIHASWEVTLEYTPGASAKAHPYPQDTTPITEKYLPPPSGEINGPPESPWQESLPVFLAQIMEEVISEEE